MCYRLIVLLGLLTHWTGLFSSALAQDKMYWTDVNANTIQRANLDGSSIEDIITFTIPEGIALDAVGGKVYWVDLLHDKIWRANLDGTEIEDLVNTGGRPEGIALDVDGGKMYWVDRSADKVQRANLDGSEIEDLVSGLDYPMGIALDLVNGKMYWTDSGTYKIQRANLDGSNVEDLVTTSLYFPVGIALDISGLILDPNKVTFGEVTTGAAKDTIFTLTNTGSDTIQVTSITATDPAFTAQPMSIVIPPGQTVTDTLRFAPTMGDSVHAVIVITSSASTSPDTLLVRGFGRTKTLAISSDTSSVAFTTKDSIQATVSFTSGQVAGQTITFESFGSTPPSVVQSVPAFDTPVFYVDFTTSIPDSVSFEANVKLTYTDTQLASAGITDESSLVVAWFDEATTTWNTVTDTLDPTNNMVTFTTTTFSVWALASVGPTGIEENQQTSLPRAFALHPNRPNPFNPSTIIAYEVPQQAHITLIVYNMLGQEVIRLVDAVRQPGQYVVTWDGTNVQGAGIASGIYMYRLTSSTGFSKTKRMALLK